MGKKKLKDSFFSLEEPSLKLISGAGGVAGGGGQVDPASANIFPPPPHKITRKNN
ncbi:hypothetical protein N483_16650 [Pseudoalteromonas luteoviolacea NCIMB 1944]|uniref:Uncharacterized protein n=1 Tax=Pseudoalteromonas luteoviolacea (strain 2ta16) TaxID=1353533 RepID=V4HPP3_PSEL2|nr:hypothetical protein PL2TA16_05404 [Pseudoalteromonas luteoviolacea 2ta16]KZN40758.1 hypothetical protein N483_16650 [Pseudoalteromonas luteoviolacea NCIMB 1944]